MGYPSSERDNTLAGIYVHIPYCRQACHYCNFHFSTNLKTVDPLVTALTKEIRHHSYELGQNQISTIYFGGGTPSLLDISQLGRIFEAIHASYYIASQLEVTLEANPEDINPDILRAWSEIGINRLSVGIQSFLDQDLVSMNRIHTAEQSISALDLIKEGPINNVTADLMFGLVDSTLEDWTHNLQKIVSFELPHLSIYNLTIEEQTVYAHQLKKRNLNVPREELQEQQYLLAEQILTEHGYDHYEISNYAKPGHRALHNTAYWDRAPYAGYGPSAHSFFNASRTWNPSNNARYISMIEEGTLERTSERLQIQDIYNEYIMLGLRRSKGVDESQIRSLGEEIWHKHLDNIAPLIANHALVRMNERLVLPKDKWYMSDHLASELFM